MVSNIAPIFKGSYFYIKQELGLYYFLFSFIPLHSTILFDHYKFCYGTVKLGIKELFDKEQIGIKEPFPMTNLPFTL